MNELIKDSDTEKFSFSNSEINFLPPVPNPPSFRDFYAFEQHVMAARKLRGLEMNPDWYKIPIFYYFFDVTYFSDWRILLPLISAVYIGTNFGKSMLGKIPEKIFKTIFKLALTLIAIRLLVSVFLINF